MEEMVKKNQTRELRKSPPFDFFSSIIRLNKTESSEQKSENLFP